MEINGREIAKKILDELEIKVQKLKLKGVIPTLAIVLVGDNPQSIAYIEQKELKANKIGAKVIVKKLKDGISEDDILNLIDELNKNPKIHGIIVQRPVKGISSRVLNNAVLPEKDVDGFNPNSKFEYPIAKAVLAILEHVFSSNKKHDQFYDYLRRSQIVLIGTGETGGIPIINSLTKQGNYSYLFVINSKTEKIARENALKKADIIISAVGKPNVLRANEIKRGVILISIGLSKGKDGKMHGDCNEKEIKEIASYYTPTPGGVGPVNVAMLLENLVRAAQTS